MSFTVVAQKKSFTQAAKHLRISKSAVSQQVSSLEAELGVRLINRTTRNLSLTATGTTLLQRCTVLQDQLSLVFNDLHETVISPSGRFAVTYPHSLESEVILPAIEQICFEFPNLEPVLIADDSPLDLVENQLDTAIHIGELPDSTYRALPIGSLKECFCATPSYIKKHGDISSLDDLVKHPWVAAPWQKATTVITNNLNQERQSITLNQFAKTNTLPASLGMVLRGLGIALVPDIAAASLFQSGKLIKVANEFTGPEWPVYSVHPYQQEKPIHVSRFHQLIYHRFNRS